MPELNAPKRQPLAVLWYTLIAPLALSVLVLALGLFASTLSTIGAALAAAALIAALVAFLLILSYPVLYYVLFSYEVSNSSLTVKSGIIFRQYETIPFDRMQVVDNERGPLLMIFGLTMIRMWTSSPDQFNIDIENSTASSHAEPDATLIIGKDDAEALKSYMTRPKGA
jgi:membrane protein YdbS with pleckstrin-like domain